MPMRSPSRPLLSMTMVTLVLSTLNLPARARTWVEDSFDDFADGRLDAAGQNLYVSRDGSVRTIHRFDLDQDGHLDLIFNSTHDNVAFIPATQCTAAAGRRLDAVPLAVEGSRRVAIADLNRDGYSDLVFCPNASGVQHPRRLVTVIWGGPDGWPPHRAAGMLPVHGAKDVAVADLNADGWPDVVTLNATAWRPAQPEGRIVRVFWGGPRGLILTRSRDFGVVKGAELAAGDFDEDGARDVAVLTDGGNVQVLWAGADAAEADDLARSEVALGAPAACALRATDFDRDGQVDLIAATADGALCLLPGAAGRQWGPAQAVDAFAASHVAAGDIDDDGHVDLVLTRLATGQAMGGEAAGAYGEGEGAGAPKIHVLWGRKGRFDKARSTPLHVPNAAAAAIGDMDGDGLPDLAVAVHQGARTFRTRSVVLFNHGDRRLEQAGPGVETRGATDVAIAPARGALAARAVFCNSRGGALHERVPLNVYWGGPDGFDAERRRDIPFTSGYEVSAADLNADGFVDLIAVDSGHAGASARSDPNLGANIFWGSDEGFDTAGRRTTLREEKLGTSNVADLNKDGYLDLVLGGFGSSRPDAHEPLVIYYGAADGFDAAGRKALHAEVRAIGAAIADLNDDDWLDIATVCYVQQRARIFWGGPDGFDDDRKTDLDVPGAIDVEVADLNRDRRLDLIIACYSDKLDQHHDMGSLIFWGHEDGYSPFNAQWLPGFTPVGPVVADWDADGHLDLFSPHYHGELTREALPSYLYWGGPHGFHTRRRTILICDSAHDGLAGDFNRDGLLDLAVSCHARDGDHHTYSRVYYNDGRRFADPEVTLLPTHGTHWMWNQDMGHVHDRSWRQTYASSIMQWEGTAAGAALRFDADVPTGTKLTFAVRAAPDAPRLAASTWQIVTAAPVTLRPADRCLQYRAVFESDNGDRYPTLERVTIGVEPK